METKFRHRIFIDPGHGGRDPGAIHPSGSPCESEVTMAAASALGMALRLLGHEVMFTPAVGLPKSEVIRAGQRARFANNNGGVLFVSIHCNACENHGAVGSEVWHYSQKKLADRLAAAIAIDSGRNRGSKQSDSLSVLVNTSMPAVLLELGFIDNDTDKDWLLEHWAMQMGRVAKCIDRWMEQK